MYGGTMRWWPKQHDGVVAVNLGWIWCVHVNVCRRVRAQHMRVTQHIPYTHTTKHTHKNNNREAEPTCSGTNSINEPTTQHTSSTAVTQQPRKKGARHAHAHKAMHKLKEYV